jgi:Domain of unknown function (DUF932)
LASEYGIRFGNQSAIVYLGGSRNWNCVNPLFVRKIMNDINQLTNPFTTTVPKLENVTERYKFISTAQFIEDVQSFGYKLEMQRSPRKGLGMHSMSFSHPDMPTGDGLSMRLLATNSHDGTSAFCLYVEVLVQVCSNGLVAWRSDAATDARIIHRGYALDKVKAAIDVVRARFDEVLGTIDKLKAIDVTPERAAAFLGKAAELRDAKPFRILDLQTVQHSLQAENNAWNVFNRVQESLVRGGYTSADTVDVAGVSQIVPGRKARELTNVRERVKVNTKLWELAVETLLKAA